MAAISALSIITLSTLICMAMSVDLPMSDDLSLSDDLPLAMSKDLPVSDDLPSPRIVILGPTGSGKSSLGDVLLGESPLCSQCTFPICDDLDSCTKQTTFASKSWLGREEVFTVVDTPGFGDYNNQDSQLTGEMMKVLNDDIGSANTILLLLKGSETRLDGKFQKMIREMMVLFGPGMWDNIVVGVSFWSYSQEEIDRRNETCQWTPNRCHNETWFKQAITSGLREKFHFQNELPFVFIDSWAKHPMNEGDKTQKYYFDQEIEKLRDIAINAKPLKCLTINDILEENQKMKERIRFLEEVSAKDINDTLEHFNERLNQNTKNIVMNGINIRWNTNSIENMEAQLTSFDTLLSQETDERKEDYRFLKDDIKQIAARVDQNEDDISNIQWDMENKPGKWSGGSYCIMANGACPEGFSKFSGHLWALEMYSANSDTIHPVHFGDSFLEHENGDHANIGITACCK